MRKTPNDIVIIEMATLINKIATSQLDFAVATKNAIEKIEMRLQKLETKED